MVAVLLIEQMNYWLLFLSLNYQKHLKDAEESD